MSSPESRQLLRHTVATLAYRASKVLRDAPPELAQARYAADAWNGTELLAHMADVLEWADGMARGVKGWNPSEADSWDGQVARFYAALAALDATLAQAGPLESPGERLFQGPIADGLTHVGQLATLRRMCGSPVRGENYHRAEVQVGRVGPEQCAPVREHDPT